MAQVPPSPWSRWDAPGFQYVLNKTKSSFPLQYDTGFENSGTQFENATQQRLQVLDVAEQRAAKIAHGWLSFAFFQEARKVRLGSCTSCYILFFCNSLLFVTLFCWLYNRSRDKRQKRFISESMDGMSPAVSQANLTAIENRIESGYYPYVGGPNQY
ncbi:hypothetical protein DINM_021975 [Dirofilaria immitis]|nr:hypothetical protein [Dirofilaria immitis]